LRYNKAIPYGDKWLTNNIALRIIIKLSNRSKNYERSLRYNKAIPYGDKCGELINSNGDKCGELINSNGDKCGELINSNGDKCGELIN
jgi:hypothetical protein